MTVIYKTESEIWGLSPQKIWRPKNVKFCWNFGLRNLIANISRWEHDIVDQKTALETTITPLRAYQIWWTLVHKRRKIGPAFRPTQSTFSDAHISGAKRSCHLKSSQLLEDDQRLLMHTSVGMGLSTTSPMGCALASIGHPEIFRGQRPLAPEIWASEKVDWLGRNAGPIFLRLCTKVHQIW